MDLLTASEWSEIRSAIQDVTDTFLKLPIVYIQRRERRLSKFHENRSDDLVQANYNLFCLMVPENKDSSQAEVKQTSHGFTDLSEGYLLFNYKDLKNHVPSLINSDGRPEFLANKDAFFLLGKEVTIIGINLVGPTQADFQLVKLQYKEQLSDSKLAPIITTDPVITGTALVGQTLNISNGVWRSSSAITGYTYQWKRNGVSIVGATNNNYLLVLADSGNSITCLVTATNSTGSTFATSAPILIT